MTGPTSTGGACGAVLRRVSMRRGVVAAIVVLAACAPREVPIERVVLPAPPPLAAPPAASLALAPPVRNQPNPFKADQYWSGSYTCAQGETDLTLHIVRVDGLRIEAEFEFDVPNGPSGSFHTSGSYDPTHAGLTLRAGDWISRPAGYQPVDLHGTVNTAGDEVEGKIDHDTCTDFSISLESDEDYD